MGNSVNVQVEGSTDRTIQVNASQMAAGSKVEITCSGIGSAHSAHEVDQGTTPTTIHDADEVAAAGIVQLTARYKPSGGAWQDLPLTFRSTSGVGSNSHQIGGRVTSSYWDEPVIIFS